MAYAAVTCLRSTILRLLESSRISVIFSTRKNLQLAYKELRSLRRVIERSEGGGGSSSHGGRFNGLDGQIIGAVQELEDSLEFHELNLFLSQSKSYGDVELIHRISSCVETLKKIKQEYIEELGRSLPEIEGAGEGHGHDDGGNIHEAAGNEFSCNMVGLSDKFDEIKRNLVAKHTYAFSIAGMAGIGKTAMAKRIYHDPSILESFECRAFVRVGQNYHSEELAQAILDQVNPSNEKHETSSSSSTSSIENLKEYLDGKRYLIVLDDVWSLGFWNDYFKERRRRDSAKGSRILVTTRSEDLAFSMQETYLCLPFLNKEESWELLRGKVFLEKACPSQLVNAGQEIAEKCEGLPLMVVTIADILSKAEATPEYWNKAAHKKNSVFEDAYNRILEVLYPSYYNLPPHTRACFLYMGAFPQNNVVRLSKLVNLWSTEGFLEPTDSTPLKCFATECFDKLVLDHVAVPAGQLSSDGQFYQACSLHSVFRHLCKKELEHNEFLHIIDRYGEDEGSSSTTQGKRRLSIHHNALLGIKDVYASLESAPTARSILCTGAYHQYQVPINFNLRLLRVCDVLTIRFYEFPLEVLELVQLRYFAITCNKNLPPSISRLWKLEYLIVHQHLSIESSTVSESYVPVEIWYLQELRYLQIKGRNLPNPPFYFTFPELVTLLDVGTHTCTHGVLDNIPKLEKLRVQIKLTPNSTKPLSHLDHISQLTRLRSFQCVVVNPILMPKLVVIPSLSVSSSSITKLTLSGLGYPWKYLNQFVKLPHLSVLKLLWYAFRGEKWEVEEKGFLRLKCLSIEDNDLVQWKAGKGAFPCLSYLTLKCCYKLQELPEITSYKDIELVDCNRAVVTCAEQKNCYVISSWDAPTDSKTYVSRVYSAY